jgi:hypothetical protein
MARYHLLPAGRVFDENTGRSFEPFDQAAWAEYQAWLAGGGVPDPLPPVPPLPPAEQAARDELAARQAMRTALRNDGTIQFLRTHTPAECEAWVQANVTDLATAKNVLGKLAMVVAYLARERLANRE